MRDVNKDKDSSLLYLPTEERYISRPWFIPSETTLKEQEALLTNVFFLVKQGDAFGERLKCTRCGARHMYITLMCVERPVAGIAGGLYAYYRAIADHQLEDELSPTQRARFYSVQASLHKLSDMPDLGTVHPDLAKNVTKDMAKNDQLIGAVALGILEGIAPTHAFRLAQKINDRGLRPPFKLGQPSTYEIQRARDYARL